MFITVHNNVLHFDLNWSNLYCIYRTMGLSSDDNLVISCHAPNLWSYDSDHMILLLTVDLKLHVRLGGGVNTITLVPTLSIVSPQSNLLITVSVCVGYVVLCINPTTFPYKEWGRDVWRMTAKLKSNLWCYGWMCIDFCWPFGGKLIK